MDVSGALNQTNIIKIIFSAVGWINVFEGDAFNDNSHKLCVWMRLRGIISGHIMGSTRSREVKIFMQSTESKQQ